MFIRACCGRQRRAPRGAENERNSWGLDQKRPEIPRGNADRGLAVKPAGPEPDDPGSIHPLRFPGAVLVPAPGPPPRTPENLAQEPPRAVRGASADRLLGILLGRGFLVLA